MKRRKLLELKKRLFEVGITQKDLARITSIPESKISQIINGAIIPDDNQIMRICKSLDRTPDQLFVVE